MKLIYGFFLLLVYQTFAQNLCSDEETTPESRPACKPGEWVASSYGEYPQGALPIGVDLGKIMYLIRVSYQGEVIPGKLHRGLAYAIWAGKEKKYWHYEVFCGGNGHWIWVRTTEKKIPKNALKAGENAKSRTLYACRANINGKTLAGKVDKGACYIPEGKSVSKVKDFDILVEHEEK